MLRFVGMCLVTAACLTVACGEEKTPSRDHIPVLKERVYALQEAVKDRNRVRIDSLMSPSILKFDQDSDSLLNFCWGRDGSFTFERFGDCVIAYNENYAAADCYVMDSTGGRDRPVRLSYKYEHDLWLLSRFEVRDTVEAEPPSEQ